MDSTYATQGLDRHKDDTASSIPKPPYIVFFWSKNIFILPVYTFNDGFDFAISLFIFNSVGIFVKLIQEYSGGA